MPIHSVLAHLGAGMASLIEVCHGLVAATELIRILPAATFTPVVAWLPVRSRFVREAGMMELIVRRLNGKGRLESSVLKIACRRLLSK